MNATMRSEAFAALESGLGVQECVQRFKAAGIVGELETAGELLALRATPLSFDGTARMETFLASLSVRGGRSWFARPMAWGLAGAVAIGLLAFSQLGQLEEAGRRAAEAFGVTEGPRRIYDYGVHPGDLRPGETPPPGSEYNPPPEQAPPQFVKGPYVPDLRAQAEQAAPDGLGFQIANETERRVYGEVEFTAAWGSGGRIVRQAVRSGNYDTRIFDADGGAVREVWPDGTEAIVRNKGDSIQIFFIKNDLTTNLIIGGGPAPFLATLPLPFSVDAIRSWAQGIALAMDNPNYEPPAITSLAQPDGPLASQLKIQTLGSAPPDVSADLTFAADFPTNDIALQDVPYAIAHFELIGGGSVRIQRHPVGRLNWIQFYNLQPTDELVTWPDGTQALERVKSDRAVAIYFIKNGLVTALAAVNSEEGLQTSPVMMDQLREWAQGIAAAMDEGAGAEGGGNQ